jgi:hypothetical protein
MASARKAETIKFEPVPIRVCRTPKKSWHIPGRQNHFLWQLTLFAIRLEVGMRIPAAPTFIHKGRQKLLCSKKIHQKSAFLDF